MEPGDATSSLTIRVLLVDDHPAVRQGLSVLLEPEGIVCAQARGHADAVAYLAENRPDVAIVDLSLDGEDGLTLVADLHECRVPALVYSMHHDARHVESAICAGALGYVTKLEFQGVLVQAIREVAAGRQFLSPKAAAALVKSLAVPPAIHEINKLSAHERQVFELLGHGEGTFEIASALHVSNHTVETYYERIKLKLNLNGMYELKRHAIEHLQKDTR